MHTVKIKSVKSKLERAGWTVYQFQDCQQFSARKLGNHYSISFLRNGGTDSETAVCLRVTRDGDRDDLQSDYFAGTYVDSISRAIGYAERWNERDKAEAKLRETTPPLEVSHA